MVTRAELPFVDELLFYLSLSNMAPQVPALDYNYPVLGPKLAGMN